MIPVLIVVGAIGWALAAGGVLVFVRGGTQQRDEERPTLGADVSEAGEPPSHGARGDGGS